MNSKIKQLLEIHDRWLIMKRAGRNIAASYADRERVEIAKTLTDTEMNQYYKALEKLNPTCDIRH